MKRIMFVAVGLLLVCVDAKADSASSLQQVGGQKVLKDPINMKMSKSEYKEYQESAVTIHADIDKDGHAINCKVTPGPNPGFNDAALRYCQTAKYKPALKNGEPVIERNRTIVLRFHRDN